MPRTSLTPVRARKSLDRRSVRNVETPSAASTKDDPSLAVHLKQLQQLLALDDWMAYGSLGGADQPSTSASPPQPKTPWSAFPRACKQVDVEGADTESDEMDLDSHAMSEIVHDIFKEDPLLLDASKQLTRLWSAFRQDRCFTLGLTDDGSATCVTAVRDVPIDSQPLALANLLVHIGSRDAAQMLCNKGVPSRLFTKATKGAAWHIVLGPGGHMRRCCGSCLYASGRAVKGKAFCKISMTDVLEDLVVGQELLFFGGPVYFNHRCNGPDHAYNSENFHYVPNKDALSPIDWIEPTSSSIALSSPAILSLSAARSRTQARRQSKSSATSSPASNQGAPFVLELPSRRGASNDPPIVTEINAPRPPLGAAQIEHLTPFRSIPNEPSFEEAYVARPLAAQAVSAVDLPPRPLSPLARLDPPLDCQREGTAESLAKDAVGGESVSGQSAAETDGAVDSGGLVFESGEPRRTGSPKPASCQDVTRVPAAIEAIADPSRKEDHADAAVSPVEPPHEPTVITQRTARATSDSHFGSDVQTHDRPGVDGGVPAVGARAGAGRDQQHVALPQPVREQGATPRDAETQVDIGRRTAPQKGQSRQGTPAALEASGGKRSRDETSPPSASKKVCRSDSSRSPSSSPLQLNYGSLREDQLSKVLPTPPPTGPRYPVLIRNDGPFVTLGPEVPPSPASLPSIGRVESGTEESIVERQMSLIEGHFAELFPDLLLPLRDSISPTEMRFHLSRHIRSDAVVPPSPPDTASETRMSLMQEEVRALEARLSKADATQSSLEAQIKRQAAELEELKHRRSEEISTLDARRAAHAREVQLLNAERRQLASKRRRTGEFLKRNCEELEREKALVESERLQLLEEKRRYLSDVDTLKAGQALLEKDVAGHAVRQQQFDTRTSQLEARLLEDRKRYDEDVATHNKATKQLKAGQLLFLEGEECLRREREAFRVSYERRQKELQESGEKLAAGNAELEKLRVSLQLESVQLETQRELLTTSRDTLAEDRKQLELQRQRIDADETALSERRRQLEGEKGVIEADRKALHAQQKLLEEDRAKVVGERQAMVAQQQAALKADKALRALREPIGTPPDLAPCVEAEAVLNKVLAGLCKQSDAKLDAALGQLAYASVIVTGIRERWQATEMDREQKASEVEASHKAVVAELESKLEILARKPSPVPSSSPSTVGSESSVQSSIRLRITKLQRLMSKYNPDVTTGATELQELRNQVISLEQENATLAIIASMLGGERRRSSKRAHDEPVWKASVDEQVEAVGRQALAQIAGFRRVTQKQLEEFKEEVNTQLRAILAVVDFGPDPKPPGFHVYRPRRGPEVMVVEDEDEDGTEIMSDRTAVEDERMADDVDGEGEGFVVEDEQ